MDIEKNQNKKIIFEKKKNKDRENTKSTKSEEKQRKIKRSEMMNLEIEEIEARVRDETPPTGFMVFSEENKNNYDENVVEAWKKPKYNFKDLPLTRKTIKGLTDSRFFKMTPIQRATLPHSLAQRDILGASKTGSGKTLCYIIPTLEVLYRNKWSSMDGLGALIILPTRELAIQVFEVFKLVGRNHDFSCGLVIGGNNVENEKDCLYKMNIIIGTPGRLLQHVTETPYFNLDNLKLLIIDEVDRILDEGFETSLNEILSYLPANRQTLLFSATLTKSLKRLAKINTKAPEYINLNNTDVIIGDTLNPLTNPSDLILLAKDPNKSSAKTEKDSKQIADNSITPINLKQYYTSVETHEKIDVLFSFLNTHKTSKCLVFLSSCKQVRFFYEVFKRLKLGMLFLDLHGKQKQKKRTNTFYTFCQKRNAVLFATDIASRGVDFPSVDWVIQFDCPEDIPTYIHRVGRTARYKSNGNSILFVNPKEEKFVDLLKARNIEAKKIKINSQKVLNLQPVIRAILSENSDLVYTAQRAISSYVKSIFLQKSKEYFDVSSINIEKLALSYGLVNMPEMHIMKKSQNENKNKSYKEINAMSDDEDDEGYNKTLVDEDADVETVEEKKNPADEKNAPNDNKKMSKLQKLKEKIKMKKIQKAEESSKLVKVEEDQDSFLKVKRANVEIKEQSNKKKRKVSDDEQDKIEEDANENGDYYAKIKKRLAANSENDKIKEKMRILEKHKHDRLKRKQRDYEKHGLIDEEDDAESYDENIDEPELVEEEEEIISKKVKKKVKINLNQATLEEKEKDAFELMDTEDNIFV